MAVQLQGMDQLMRQLQQMGRTLDGQVVEKALKEGAELMQTKIIEIAPERLGTLKENIVISDIVDGKIDIGPDQQGDAFYAHILEIGRKAGTSKIKRNGKKIDYHYPPMPPKPFMGPAYENNKQAVQDKMGDVIKRELNL